MRQNDSSPAADAAVEALRRGLMPLPIWRGDKKPYGAGWTRPRFDSAWTEEGVRSDWAELEASGVNNIGLLLGSPGGNLVDVDIDHGQAHRVKDLLLPKTAMRSGRPHNPDSHYWYLAMPGTLQGTRQFKMPDKSMIIEYRSTGGQSVIPPSTHPDQEQYRWEGEPWGGEDGPALVDGRDLAIRVGFVGLVTVLMENWPSRGGRHEAYLALAGGLLRFGDEVNGYWEKNVASVITALVVVTGDRDGIDARIAESVPTTIAGIRSGDRITGWGKLAEIIGDAHVTQARRTLLEIERMAGLPSRNATSPDPRIQRPAAPGAARSTQDAPEVSDDPDAATDPGDGTVEAVVNGSWDAVDLEPYIAGKIVLPEPTVLQRSDSAYLMYPGRINMVFGNSETAKSWIVLQACLQEIGNQGKVLYMDFEDDAGNTVGRMRLLGAADDTFKDFRYLSPFTPHAAMERNAWGLPAPTDVGQSNLEKLNALIEEFAPTLIVVDGMTELYGIHNLNSNDTSSTSVITEWLRSLTLDGYATVIVIDHAPKDAARGALPIGSQHKVSMVQGTLLQTHMKRQPMPGAIGEIELIVMKDRPGRVRSISSSSGAKAQTAAIVTMDSTSLDRTVMRIDPPAPPGRSASTIATIDLRNQKIQRADGIRKAQVEMMRWLMKGDQSVRLKKSEIALAFGFELDDHGRSSRVDYMLKWMIDRGEIVAEGSGNGRRYSLYASMDGYDIDDSQLDHVRGEATEDLLRLDREIEKLKGEIGDA